MSPLFEAAADATEEAIVNALCMATTVTGVNGHTSHAVPLDRVQRADGEVQPFGILKAALAVIRALCSGYNALSVKSTRIGLSEASSWQSVPPLIDPMSRQRRSA